MAKTFFFLFLFAGTFCLGQWSALEGYTLGKAIRWAENQTDLKLPHVDVEQLLKRAGISQLGGWFKKTDGKRLSPMRPVPGERYKATAAHSSARGGDSVAAQPASAPADEEGLSPTDREALLDLLK